MSVTGDARRVTHDRRTLLIPPSTPAARRSSMPPSSLQRVWARDCKAAWGPSMSCVMVGWSRWIPSSMEQCVERLAVATSLPSHQHCLLRSGWPLAIFVPLWLGEARVVSCGRRAWTTRSSFSSTVATSGWASVVSRRLAVPLVLRVEALETREEESWGVRRRGFRRLVERSGELPLFRAADLLVSVSREVDSQLAELGIHSSRRLVLANGVDTAEFTPGDPEPEILDDVRVARPARDWLDRRFPALPWTEHGSTSRSWVGAASSRRGSLLGRVGASSG